MGEHEQTFRVLVAVKVRTCWREPAKMDAEELVRVALQTIHNDGYEDDAVTHFDFEVLGSTRCEP